MKIKFDRQEYLALGEIFEVGQLDDVTLELSEFSDDIEDMAYELAYTRYELANAEARHAALEKDHNVSLMLLARERVQRDSLLTLRDTDEWRTGVAIGGHIVSTFVAERKLKTLKNSHNALVEAVAWERECDEFLKSKTYSFFVAWEHLHAASTEVDLLLVWEEGK